MKKYYHVYSFVSGNKLPTIASCYKTKSSALKQYKNRVDSSCWDSVILWVEMYDDNNKPIKAEKLEVYTA